LQTCPAKNSGGLRGSWVCVARFWDMTQIYRFIEGLYIAYCDVANLFGGSRGNEAWDDFYKLMTQDGFLKRWFLERYGRGGLIVL